MPKLPKDPGIDWASCYEDLAKTYPKVKEKAQQLFHRDSRLVAYRSSKFECNLEDHPPQIRITGYIDQADETATQALADLVGILGDEFNLTAPLPPGINSYLLRPDYNDYRKR